VEFLKPVIATPARKLNIAILSLYLILAVFGPTIAPTGPTETIQASNGSYLVLVPPSLEVPLGTTQTGFSVLSRTLIGFRTTVLVGIVTGGLVVTIGVNIGLISGYYGGRLDNAVMAVVDLIYGLPLYPLAIVLVALLGTGLFNIVLISSIVLWRSVSRVIRSEVLSIKGKPYVKSSKAVGTSDLKIMYSQILPNLLPLIILYWVLGAIWGILVEASLSFLGLGDPNAITWGFMLYDVFNSGLLVEAWWMTIPPTLCLSVFIFSLYTISRSLEDNVEKGESTAM
jgi:peptide/nickel transport system permease protein